MSIHLNPVRVGIFSIIVLLLLVVTSITGITRQEEERIIEQHSFSNEPVKLTAARTKKGAVKIGKEFNDETDWFKGLKVIVENVSGKPVTSVLILLAGLSLGSSILPITSLASFRTFVQKKGRVLRHRKFQSEPVRILQVKNKRRALLVGPEFLEEDDWLKGLTIFVKNSSDKTITFIGIELHFIKPGAGDDEPIYAHQLFYNIGDHPQPPVKSQAVATIKLTEEDYENVMRALNQYNYRSGATEVEIIIDGIKFSEGSAWKSGLSYEDATSFTAVHL
jgi:hypothetical protein